MTSRLLQLTGVKASEKNEVTLFFLHNFFIGIGSILIYTSANVILLENHPEFSLPMAYVVSAVVMMGVARVYEHYEHTLSLKRLSSSALLTSCVLAGVIMLASFFSHSLLMAIAIMVGFRVIYLLVNLEFWGLSALLFDVRQSKRLFGIIGAGDMPAKLLGAILAALIHSPSAVPLLIGIAVVMFLLALATQKRTFASAHISKGHHADNHSSVNATKYYNLLSRNQLIFRVSLGYALMITIAIFIEYSFFVNVKHKFHSQHDVMTFVGQVLAVTFLVGMVFKLLFTQKSLERLGVKTALYLLPALALGLSAILVVLLTNNSSDQQLLIYFCVYYLSFEVIRRTIFDPVFLLIFQPLNSHERLRGHTLAKGFYEPFGMILTGTALLLAYFFPALQGWFDFVFVALIALMALVAFAAAYRSYVFTLQNAIKRRFLPNEAFGVQQEAAKVYESQLESTNPTEVLTAIDWLQNHRSNLVVKHAEALLKHKDARVRETVFRFLDTAGKHRSNELYARLLHEETDPTLKYLLAKRLASPELLASADKDVMRGAIAGGIEQQLPSARRALDGLLNSPYEHAKLLGLAIVEATNTANDYAAPLAEMLTDASEAVRLKALEIAPAANVIPYLSTPHWKSAVKNLASDAADIELVINMLPTADNRLLQRLLKVAENAQTPERQKLLLSFVRLPRTRLAALRLLNKQQMTLPKADFDQIIAEEFTLSRRLLSGLADENLPHLTSVLTHENERLTERLFLLLMLQYDKNSVLNAMLGIRQQQKERRANSFEILENILPKRIFQPLHGLLDDSLSAAAKLKEAEKFAGITKDSTPLVNYILQKGDREFGDWTIAQTIQRALTLDPTLLAPYAVHANPLFRESIRILSKKTTLPTDLTDNAFMKHTEEDNRVSFIERVISLKNTPLFHAISENVLSAVAPIMQELPVEAGQIIFEKDELGDSMYVIFEGDISIRHQQTELARFGKYDFFGELALLDAEARSATAVALTDSLLFKITQEDFYELLEEQPELMRNIIKALSQRIRLQNAKMTGR